MIFLLLKIAGFIVAVIAGWVAMDWHGEQWYLWRNGRSRRDPDDFS